MRARGADRCLNAAHGLVPSCTRSTARYSADRRAAHVLGDRLISHLGVCLTSKSVTGQDRYSGWVPLTHQFRGEPSAGEAL
jgi:hypothetical protein